MSWNQDSQKEFTKLKAALTRAKNSGKPEKVIAEVHRAKARFDIIGWPDCWATWDIAENDARFKLRYER